MTDPTPNRPLVTFALFAYNQEQHIREAVEGAFSQTYEPLEIILSDDFSSDRTFEIMQEMAAAYEGPHEVRVRRSEINFGTALHLSCVAASMNGELLIVAAGDDISKPIRTETIVTEWIKKGISSVSALHSALELKYDNGETHDVPLKQGVKVKTDLGWFLQKDYNPMLGPTCAYNRHIFEEQGPLLGGSLIEDTPLMLRAMISGELVAVDEPLITQRYVTESAGRNHHISNAKRWNRFVHSRMTARVNALLDIADNQNMAKSIKYSLEKKLIQENKKLSSLLVKSTFSRNSVTKAFLVIKFFFQNPRRRGVITGMADSLKFVYGGEKTFLSPKTVSQIRKLLRSKR
jgi:glycosyltransferase involved in cell wall biosynthesis